jgi:hypothetical protein
LAFLTPEMAFLTPELAVSTLGDPDLAIPRRILVRAVWTWVDTPDIDVFWRIGKTGFFPEEFWSGFWVFAILGCFSGKKRVFSGFRDFDPRNGVFDP